jgi:hypothetical protein
MRNGRKRFTVENPLTKSDSALVQRAKAEEIEDLTATIVETTREVDRATDALVMLNDAVDNFRKKKETYTSWSTSVRKKIQKLASEI